jgi:hypothetical protein
VGNPCERRASRLSGGGFDVLVTTDHSLRYQQNLSGRRLAILALPTTSWPKIKAHAAAVVEAIAALRPGDYLQMTF